MKQLPQMPPCSHKLAEVVESNTPQSRRFDADGIRYLVGKTNDYRLSGSIDVDDPGITGMSQKGLRYIVKPSSGLIPVKVDSREGYRHRSELAAKNKAKFNQYAEWVEFGSVAELIIEYKPAAISLNLLTYWPRIRVGDYTWGHGVSLKVELLVEELFAVSGFNKPFTRKPPLELYFYDRPVWELRPYGSGTQRTIIQQFHPNGVWGLQQELGKTITYDPESDA